MAGCYLYPVPAAKRPPASDLHETGGIPGNWALDYMAKPGSLILSPVDGQVTRWSGHDPAAGELPGAVFGWSLYVDGQSLELFATHMSRRFAEVGQHVCRGDRLGIVGHWPDDIARSHCHLGVTQGNASSSKREALKISRALLVHYGELAGL